MNAIISLRGNLTPLVWPAALDERIRASHLVRQEWEAAKGTREANEISTQHQGIQRSAARIFFEAQGWQLRASRDHPSTLFGHRLYPRGGRAPGIDGFFTIRHAHFAFDRGQHIGAVVTHLYGPHVLAALPSNVAVDLLPDSWYFAGWAKAICLRFDPTLTDDGTLRGRLVAIGSQPTGTTPSAHE